MASKTTIIYYHYFCSLWCSQANNKQRRGRAGRVQKGFCLQLFTKSRHNKLPRFPVPEMMRIAMEELCLTVKALMMGNIFELLNKAMDPPHKQTITHSVHLLQTIGALDFTGQYNITPLGRILAHLPIHPQLGRMLLLGVLFRCIDPILTVAAG